MNYKIHKFVQDLLTLVQNAVNDGIPVYVVPYVLRETIGRITPAIDQAVENEAPKEPEWHPNEEFKMGE